MTLVGHFFTLSLFSFVLAAVVSGYRDDEPREIIRGIPRRGLLFGGTVLVIAWASWLLGASFLAV